MRKLFIMFMLAPIAAFGLTAEEIIEKVDQNEVFENMGFEATMTIEKSSRTLVKEFYGYGEGESKFFMEFTNPEDEGVKYLKIDDEMWIYFPDADDTLKISGHMLNQGMMGSDISYEDMMENEELLDQYEPTLGTDTNINGTDCYQIILEAIVDDVTYEKEVVYVDKTKYVLIQIDMYARGDRMIKQMSFDDYEKVGTRWYAMTMTIEDTRKSDSLTTIEYDSIEFDATLPKNIFTLQYLER